MRAASPPDDRGVRGVPALARVNLTAAGSKRQPDHCACPERKELEQDDKANELESHPDLATLPQSRRRILNPPRSLR